MQPVRVVLSNGEDDEHLLGEYNQGVVFDSGVAGWLDVIDVASGDVVCQQIADGWRWGDVGPYSQLFVHSVLDMPPNDDLTIVRREHKLSPIIAIDGHQLLLEPLSTRAQNLMRRYGFKTVEDVAEVTERYISHLPGVGQNTVEELRLSLNTYGLDYREET